MQPQNYKNQEMKKVISTAPKCVRHQETREVATKSLFTKRKYLEENSNKSGTGKGNAGSVLGCSASELSGGGGLGWGTSARCCWVSVYWGSGTGASWDVVVRGDWGG